MNFQHTEDRRMLADTLNRFVTEQYGFDVRERIATSADGFSAELWARFAALGVIGALFDEAHGGFGGDGFDVAVVFESLGRGLVVEPFLDTLIVGQALVAAGSERQQALLGGLIDGSRVVAFAHDEPGSHYETSRVTTRAVGVGGDFGGAGVSGGADAVDVANAFGDGAAGASGASGVAGSGAAHTADAADAAGGWIVTGAKAVVQHGERADLFLVSARTGGNDDYAESGISLFLIPRDTPGVKVRGYRKIDGGRAAELTLDNVKLDAGALLGVLDQGLATLEHSVGYGLLALCAEAIGAMDVAKDHTLDYLRTRQQFGVPIGSFQALQHRMADLLLEIEQARSAVINAAAALSGERAERGERRTRERALSAAKTTIGRIGAKVAEECIQLHGGIGMTWELPLAHYAKRLVMIDHQLGDEDHHLQRYIALGRG